MKQSTNKAGTKVFPSFQDGREKVKKKNHEAIKKSERPAEKTQEKVKKLNQFPE